jgi:hypothetical protein
VTPKTHRCGPSARGANLRRLPYGLLGKLRRRTGAGQPQQTLGAAGARGQNSSAPIARSGGPRKKIEASGLARSADEKRGPEALASSGFLRLLLITTGLSGQHIELLK